MKTENTTNTTNAIFDKLFERLLYPMLVYLPKGAGEVFKQSKEFKVLDKFVGIMLAIENKSYNFIVTEQSNLLFLIGKSKLLESNMFDLLDAKENLSNEQFHFLANKYKSHVDSWVYITQELKKDIVKINHDLFIKNKGYIEFQATNLEQHQMTIENHFPNVYKTKHKVGLEHLKARVLEYEKNKQIKNQQEVNKKTTIKKQHLISTQEVDNYLLKKVFGVNVKDF